MRIFFRGPRILGIRPGVSFSGSDFARQKGSKKRADAPRPTGSFIYVIEGEAGKHKIGVSSDPIARISQLQTGAPLALKFAYVGATPGNGYNIESAAHQMLDAYRTSGEWFMVPASIAIGSILESAARLGQPIQQVQPEMVPHILAMARSQEDAESGLSTFDRIMMVVLILGCVAIGFGIAFPGG